ncbi:hypothetical protein KF728_09110 [Candidatus Obscuribacterales bacterium]|nr:hypothetical protein [Candidatus Obscuribacterales bacterium]
MRLYNLSMSKLKETIQLRKVRQLDIEPTADSRPKYVYAASGLARIDDQLYIVADDELHLAIFEENSSIPGKWLRLASGSLPVDYDQRKKAKPDLESITYIEPYEYASNGALLVVPSMSRKTRINGMLLLLDENKRPTDQVLPIDFTAIRQTLTDLVEELNIEGVVVTAETVKLFHRGSKDKSKSAVIDTDAKQFLKDLHDTHAIRPDFIIDTTEYELGAIADVPLQFTDAVQLSDRRILFLATSENSTNAFDDGASFGSAVGILSRLGEVEKMERFVGQEKLEGVSVRSKGKELELLLVSDTDNQDQPANLFKAFISL